MLRPFFVLLLWFVLSSFLSPRTSHAQLKRFHFTENKMGSPFNIIFYHTDSLEASTIAHECFLLVDSLNNIFSDYSAESEVGKLVSQPPGKEIAMSRELFHMLLQSKSAWKFSGKTFDVTIGSLTQLWRKARAENRFPDEEEIKQAKRSAGFRHVSYDVHTHRIVFERPGMRLDFGGIVKGYAAQQIIDRLRTRNITIALADAGGDMAMADPPPGKNGWNIAINLPEKEQEFWDKKLSLKNYAVATSGDIYHYIEHDGKKYSHIIDPRTGYGLTSQRNVTIIARSGTTADWMATACSILPIRKALRLARKQDCEIFIATIKNGKVVTYSSKNFERYFER